MDEMTIEQAFAEVSDAVRDRGEVLCIVPTQLILNEYWSATPERVAVARAVAQWAERVHRDRPDH